MEQLKDVALNSPPYDIRLMSQLIVIQVRLLQYFVNKLVIVHTVVIIPAGREKIGPVGDDLWMLVTEFRCW